MCAGALELGSLRGEGEASGWVHGAAPCGFQGKPGLAWSWSSGPQGHLSLLARAYPLSTGTALFVPTSLVPQLCRAGAMLVPSSQLRKQR